MKKAIEIVIKRAEGRTAECIVVECTPMRAFTTGYHGRGERKNYPVATWADDVWTRANAILASWSHTVESTSGGCDKCDFVVIYEDGEKYEGRYDLYHMQNAKHGGYPSLERHMRAFLGCMSGREKPAHLSAEVWIRYFATIEEETRKSAAEFLDAYEVGKSEEKAA